MKSFLMSVVIGSISLMVSLPTFALENRKINIGASFGTANDDLLNEDSSAYKLTLGYKVSDNLSYDIEYVDLGDYFFDFISQSGVSFNIIGSLPVTDDFSIFGKAGLFAWTLGASGFEDDTGTDITYGFGLMYDITTRVSLVGEYEFYEVSDGDVDLISAGLKISF